MLYTKYLLFIRSVLQLLVTANVVPTSLIPFALMVEAIRNLFVSARYNAELK
jgi:hypothetical protein